ncbi:hypothetical protein [Pseudoalteromonas spongiae]|uniref:hypothetical protein n=1 Tax=Pseudoalteromonas spongiae TaxID=298657 RepID=UPI000C2D1585|nr:hypothetical protein [Pseudoalteromonas spongiae]
MRWVVIFFVLNIFSSSSLQANVIDIYIRDDVYKDYTTFVNNRDITSIKNFSGKAIRRDVVDMIIAQQALKLGGFNFQFNYIPGKVNFRNTRMLETGKLLISFDSYWLADAHANANFLYITKPLIRRGEYIAGVYTKAGRENALGLAQMSDFKRLSAVSTPKWRTDWKTLSDLPLKELVIEHEWISMARMVNTGWVDFMLMPFNATADQSFKLDKINLVPVPNVAIELKDSRHFVISRNHPLGSQAYLALEKGLNILRKKGAIEKAYTQAGFFVDKQNLNIINAQ